MNAQDLVSSKVVYSEHGYDECFEYADGSGRIPDGIAIGYQGDRSSDKIILFKDVKYSSYDHDYWDNLELENDITRIILP